MSTTTKIPETLINRINQFRSYRSHIVKKFNSTKLDSSQLATANVIRETMTIADDVINELFTAVELIATMERNNSYAEQQYSSARETLDSLYNTLYMGFGISKEQLFTVQRELRNKNLVH